jgi:muconolactone delta-isomerase
MLSKKKQNKNQRNVKFKSRDDDSQKVEKKGKWERLWRKIRRAGSTLSD